MNNISNTVFEYFLQHFAELPLDKQLHFSSRLWLWRDDAACQQLFEQLRPAILPTGDVIESLRGIRDGTLLPLRQGSLNAQSFRAPYFARYPTLRHSSTVLYWAVLFDRLYGTNAHSRIHELLPAAELATLYEALSTDEDALAALSTHAVNFMYLYQRYVLGTSEVPELSIFEKLAGNTQLYDLADPVQLQLYIYLVTHCVVGESLFYTKAIPAERLATLRAMLQGVERAIAAHLETVNLDNKCEFLVCAKLVGYVSKLEERIISEADASISGTGTFIVDNAARQSTYTAFDKSEHRNVLYIMACSEPAERLQVQQ